MFQQCSDEFAHFGVNCWTPVQRRAWCSLVCLHKVVQLTKPFVAANRSHVITVRSEGSPAFGHECIEDQAGLRNPAIIVTQSGQHVWIVRKRPSSQNTWPGKEKRHHSRSRRRRLHLNETLWLVVGNYLLTVAPNLCSSSQWSLQCWKNCPKLTLNWFCVLRFQIASMRFNMCKNLCGGEEKRRRTVLCQLSDGFSSQLEEACLVSQRFAKSRECFVFQCISVRFLIQDGVWWAGRVLSQGRPGGPRLCLLICLACACTACSFS